MYPGNEIIGKEECGGRSRMRRSTGIHPVCPNTLRESQKSEVKAVVNCCTHEQIKEQASLETMMEKMFTKCRKAAGNFCSAVTCVELFRC